MEFSQRLQDMMTEHGISRSKLAKEIGVTTTAVTNWIDNGSLPVADKLKAIADYFGVSTDNLLGEIPHQNYREVISENGIKVLLDADAKISDDDLKEVVSFIRWKQSMYGH